jgi:DNA-binding LacI/PurR family transcriptional regulator
MTSLRDVARRAEVSVATASRVASGALPVRPETRERVERAMRELLYVPPGRRPETGLIGVLVPELANPIFPALAQAIETRAAPDGLASILCNTHEAAFREVDYVHMLLDRRVQGMIFIACEMTNLRGDHGHYAKLVGEGARLVFVNGALHTLDVPSVGVDERAAGEIATQHLVELGHERIGFLAGLEHYLPTQLKAAGRESALRGAGLDPDGLVAYAPFGVDGGRRALAELLSRERRPTAVICSSDLMAIGALHEASRRGVAVPQELSIVGFDGIDATTWTAPQLTTVEQPIAEIADTAVSTLESLIADPERPVPNSYFRPLLRVRGTTAPPARSSARRRAAATS